MGWRDMRRRSSTRSATGDVWLDAKPRYEKCMVSGTKIWVNGKAVSTKGLGVLGRQGRDTFISSNPLSIIIKMMQSCPGAMLIRQNTRDNSARDIEIFRSTKILTETY